MDTLGKRMVRVPDKRDSKAVPHFIILLREVRVYVYDLFMEFFHLILLELG